VTFSGPPGWVSVDAMAASLLLSAWARRTAGAVVALASLASVVAGGALAHLSLAGPVTVTSPTAARTPATSSAATTSTRLVLRFGDHVATAIMDDTSVARQVAAQLPLTVQLSDRMGQLKSGPLPPPSRPLDVTGADPTYRTVVGELSYWSPSAQVAVVYDDVAQRSST
jgi:hypothetical protein